ncbi:hypothetical protein EBH_0040830 [Eimeria brunetti]|uniref:Uncharacterized protein n=1 Tax=Eimeria brunetti TaxID=51314 RepID=U6LLQ9_9EIME|nr:hypothetical protein EBH_0040830 [Eimeria brunetti]
MTASPFSRRLAASLGSEECDESEASTSTDSPADNSGDGQMVMPPRQAYVVEGAHARSGNTEPTSSTERTAADSGERVSGAAAPRLEAQRSQADLKRKVENQSTVETKRLRLQPLKGETQVQPPPSPLDPQLDSLIDSVLAGGANVFSEAFWLHENEPVQPIVDASIGSSSLEWGRDSERPHLDQAGGYTMDVLPQGPCTPPSPRGKPNQNKGDGEWLPAGMPGSQKQLGSSPSVEALKHRPSADTAEAHLGITAPLGSGSTEQSASAPAQLLDEDVVSYSRWLEKVYPGVPESVLITHPFYRHPEHEPALSTRTFNLELAEFLASVQHNPNAVLATCREIMMKPSPAEEDYRQLVIQAERLYGYAIAKMLVTCRRRQATDAIEVLGTVFLVVDALHCAAEVLGDRAMKHLWWPTIVRKIESARFRPNRKFLAKGKCLRNSEIACALDAALEYYRRGCRAPVRMVIGLKEALFCEPRSSKFNVAHWNPWRDAAVQWRRSIQRSLADKKNQEEAG